MKLITILENHLIHKMKTRFDTKTVQPKAILLKSESAIFNFFIVIKFTNSDTLIVQDVKGVYMHKKPGAILFLII